MEFSQGDSMLMDQAPSFKESLPSCVALSHPTPFSVAFLLYSHVKCFDLPLLPLKWGSTSECSLPSILNTITPSNHLNRKLPSRAIALLVFLGHEDRLSNALWMEMQNLAGLPVEMEGRIIHKDCCRSGSLKF